MRLTKAEIYFLPLVLIGTAGLVWVAYRLAGFIGIGVLGLLIGFIAVRMDLEKDGAMGSAFSAGLHAQHVMARHMASGAERAAHRAEMRSLTRSLGIAKIIAATLAVLGFGGLYYFG